MSAIFGCVDWNAPPAPLADSFPRIDASAAGAPAEASAGATVRGAALIARHSTVPVGVANSERVAVALLGFARFDDSQGDYAAADAAAANNVATLYQRFGVDLLSHIHGPFAVALADAATHTALLAVDRLGIRTLCFAHDGGRLIFGSTADHVVAHPGMRTSLSEQGLFNYLY